VIRRPQWFYGWWIVVVAFIAFAVNTGLIFYTWSVFLTPLAATFGSRARVSGAYAAMQLSSAAYGLLVGRIVDQRGARDVQLVGAVMLTLGFWSMAAAPTLPFLYLAMMGPLAIGTTCIGALPNNAAVARWFVRRRGRALGLSTAGISAGGILCAPLAQWLLDHYGWRVAYALLGAGVLVVLVPPVALLMRRDPADLGLVPDGEPAPGSAAASAALLEYEAGRSVRPAVAVRQPAFWLLAAAFALTMTGLSCVLLYQVPLLLDHGMPAQQASIVLGALAAMGVLGKLGFGALLDRFDQRHVAAVCFVLQGVGVGLLLAGAGAEPVLLVSYVVLYGYTMGGNATLLASLSGEAFGRLHYGAISGRMTPVLVVTQAIAVPMVGYVRDRTGSFTPVLLAVIAASVVAAGLILRVRLPQKRPPPSAQEEVPSRSDQGVIVIRADVVKMPAGLTTSTGHGPSGVPTPTLTVMTAGVLVWMGAATLQILTALAEVRSQPLFSVTTSPTFADDGVNESMQVQLPPGSQHTPRLPRLALTASPTN
jgi:MFS family permease